MDRFYYVKGTAALLEHEVARVVAHDIQLLEYIKNNNLFNSLQTRKCAYGSSWQLLKDASGRGKEKALFRIQGILQYRDLPPIPANQALKVKLCTFVNLSESLDSGLSPLVMPSTPFKKSTAACLAPSLLTLFSPGLL
ncbi:hypothetical protein CPB83DRAFT_900403 [Crepidotus variabilis]|uniref:Uncharacterized protein n=1 Tax=Crepidotus variabilis TaxID=179855 RepID=A0A9P6E384_9AGAR|nr:hypothetical protein CPB83DRAFT_900403 [Crepidotus variabilis]